MIVVPKKTSVIQQLLVVSIGTVLSKDESLVHCEAGPVDALYTFYRLMCVTKKQSS